MVNGIDNPIMVQRTTDFVRDNSALVKRTELMQESALRQNQAQFEQEARFVVDVENMREKTVNKDAQRKAAVAAKVKKRKSEAMKNLPAGLSEAHHIDIEI